jgi:hypothetical protein
MLPFELSIPIILLLITTIYYYYYYVYSYKEPESLNINFSTEIETTDSNFHKNSMLLPKSSPSPKAQECKPTTPPTDINETEYTMASHENEKTDFSKNYKWDEANVKKTNKTSRIKELNTRIVRAAAQLYKDKEKRFVNTISTPSTLFPILTNPTKHTTPSAPVSTPSRGAEIQPPTMQATPLLPTVSAPTVSTPQILEPLLASTSFPPTNSTTLAAAASATVVPAPGETTKTAPKEPKIFVPVTESTSHIFLDKNTSTPALTKLIQTNVINASTTQSVTINNNNIANNNKILVPATIAGSPFTMAYSATRTVQAQTNAVRLQHNYQ